MTAQQRMLTAVAVGLAAMLAIGVWLLSATPGAPVNDGPPRLGPTVQPGAGALSGHIARGAGAGPLAGTPDDPRGPVRTAGRSGRRARGNVHDRALASDGTGREHRVFHGPCYADIATGPDGLLYFMDEVGSLYRIVAGSSADPGAR